jgi:hypothetical protein
MRPREFRPPVRFLITTRLFSGRVFVISSKVSTVWNRRPADVGFSFLTGIVLVLSSGR